MAWVGVRGLPLAPPQNRMCKFPFIRLKPFNGRRRSERPSRLAAGSSGIHCCRPRIKLRDRGRRAGLRVQGANHTRTITRKPCRLQSKSRHPKAGVVLRPCHEPWEDSFSDTPHRFHTQRANRPAAARKALAMTKTAAHTPTECQETRTPASPIS